MLTNDSISFHRNYKDVTVSFGALCVYAFVFGIHDKIPLNSDHSEIYLLLSAGSYVSSKLKLNNLLFFLQNPKIKKKFTFFVNSTFSTNTTDDILRTFQAMSVQMMYQIT
jgi:hypothetical protein